MNVGDLVKSRGNDEAYGIVFETHKQFALIQLFCGWFGWLPETQWEVINEA